MADPAGAAAPLPDAAALYDQAACGLLVTRGDGTILRANRRFCEWVGHAPEALEGQRRFQDLLTVGGRIFHQTHWLPLLQMQGSVSEVKMEVMHADGTRLPIVLNAVRRESAGAVRHELALLVATDRDRYERELMRARERAETLLASERATRDQLAETQAQLERTLALAKDRALVSEQMMGVVSHDLRNPLAAMAMSAQLLLRMGIDAAQRRVVQRILGSGERASRLISDLLDFTQARLGGGLRVQPRPIDLHAVVREAVEELRAAFAGHVLVHHAVTIPADPRATERPGGCDADADRLVQLVGNLVANAMGHGAPDQPVTVESRVDADGFAISVHNLGQPIPADRIPTLFDPMTRGPAQAVAGRRPAASGSVGLGLYIVREIARAHGGDVSVASDAAHGTTFTSRVPAPRAP